MMAMDHSEDSACAAVQDPGVDAHDALRRDPSATRAANARVGRADFLSLIDDCVRYLAAQLSSSKPADGLVEAAEAAGAQLWRWLHADPAVLDDGTPITFAVFDSALQRIGERLPRRGLPGQENVLHAALLLAEATHARTPASIAGLRAAGALP